jgi:zinc protease
MAGKICNISPYISAQSEGMYGSSSLKDLETAMQMMYMYFTNPRIDDAGYASYMEQLSSELKLKSLSPEAVFSDSVQFLMAGRSERRKPQTLAMLDKINRDEALKIYKERFEDAGQFTFVFVGKIDEEKLKPLVEKYIGSLPSKKGKETPADEGIKYPAGKNEKIVKKGMEPKAQVSIYYNGDFEYTPENRLRSRALTMLANIKLRESLREDKGGVYGVGCYIQPEAYPTGRYKMGISFGCDPTRADELINAAYKVIDEIKSGGANATDLNKVKETLRREFESDTKENNYWMSLIRNNVMYGENYEGYLNFLNMVEAIKGEDFKGLADKYFNANNRFVFKLMPEK